MAVIVARRHQWSAAAHPFDSSNPDMGVWVATRACHCQDGEAGVDAGPAFARAASCVGAGLVPARFEQMHAPRLCVPRVRRPATPTGV